MVNISPDRMDTVLLTLKDSRQIDSSNQFSKHDHDSCDLHDTITNDISASDISSCSMNKEHM